MAQEKLYFDNKNSKFKKLSEDKIFHLISLYEGKDLTLYEIENNYPEYKSGSHFKNLPYHLSNELCIYCGSEIYIKLKRVTKENRETARLCRNCKHDYTTTCECPVCLLEREKQLEENIIIFKKLWEEQVAIFFQTETELKELSIMDEFKIGLLMAHYYNDKSGLLEFPRKNVLPGHTNPAIAPEFTMTFEYLVNRQWIIPVADISSIDGIEYYLWNLQVYYLSFPMNLKWQLNLKEEGKALSLRKFKKYLEERTLDDETKIQLWNEVFRNEITDYLQFYSQMFLKINMHAITCDMVSELLFNRFSLSKSFALIYYSLSSTWGYYNNHKTSEKHLNTYFRNKMVHMTDKFKNDKTFKDFDRPPQMPFSKMNEYFVNDVLNIKGNYFYNNTKTIFPQTE